jgi:hypothetical protein
MPETLKSWFSLKPNRDNFKPQVFEDRRLIFCHEDQLSQQILNSIQMRFAANEPIKMLLFGDWGVGKTHTANHICWWLDQNKADYPVTPVMIEVGDITARSRFDVLVRPFLDKLGLDFLINLTSKFQAANPNVPKALQDIGVPLYIASVISKFNMATPGITPPAVVPEAFNILRGKKPQAGGAPLGLAEQLTDSTDFYAVLLAIGHMHRVVERHRLLFIADEAAKLDKVENDEATLAHWVATNRLIFDDENKTFGFIYTLSAKGERALPQAIWDPQIQTRIGTANKCELKSLASGDVTTFLRKLVDEFVDKEATERLVASGGINASDYNWDSYPFTASAKSEFVDYYQRAQEYSKPRDISDRLNTVGFIALKKNKRLITEECLAESGM